MPKGLWRATFIGGFIAWLWMAISWTVIPWHCALIQSFPDEKGAVSAIEKQVSESGIYAYPNMCTGELEESTTQVFLSINKTDAQPGLILPYVISLITYFIGGLIVALIVMQMAASTYGWKLFAVTMIGLAIGVMSMIPAWNWWGFPFNYALLMIVDNALAWLFAGLVIAAFIHPRKPKSDRTVA